MREIKWFRIVIIGTLVSQTLSAGIWGSVSVTELQKRAGVIAAATVVSASTDSTHAVSARLHVIKVIQGHAAGPFMTVRLAPSGQMSSSGIASTLVGTVGATGVWFIQLDEGGAYRVLPTAEVDYSWVDAFIPVTTATLDAMKGDAAQQLLTIVVNWYQSITDPNSIDDQRLLVNLDGGNSRDTLRLARELIASPLPNNHVIGLTAAIRLGSDSAIAALARELPTLRAHPKFDRITEALHTYYQPHGDSSIGVLQQLVSLHSDAPGIDAAAGSALQKIGSKAVLPAMAELLDSRDPQAQLRAAWFFGYFTLFADTDGNIGHEIGPWSSDATRLHMPRADSAVTPQEYSVFWKSWWSAHRSDLGFAAP